jgi:hypothetical protein
VASEDLELDGDTSFRGGTSTESAVHNLMRQDSAPCLVVYRGISEYMFGQELTESPLLRNLAADWIPDWPDLAVASRHALVFRLKNPQHQFLTQRR